MSTVLQGERRDRIAAAVAVAAVHALLGYAFLAGLRLDVVQRASEALKVFSLAEEPPPAPTVPEPKESRDEEGEAAPPNLRARPKPVTAPPPKLPPPKPAPAPPVAAEGAAAAAGATEQRGPGTGAGGVGAGLGSGGSGTGAGGGVAVHARQIAGRIRDADYPDAASRIRAEGVVRVRFTVTRDGDATHCAVLRSSGNADLDSTTCRLIERRFRFRPARTASGEPVAEMKIWEQRWWLEGRGG